MKKSLLLMALLGSMTAASLHAEEKVVMWDGVTYDEKTLTVTGAVTSYKHEPSEWRAPAPGDTGDCYMCGPASASNVLAWWLDRVEQNGALIVRNGVPRDYAVWEEVRKLYINKAVNASWVLQFWLTGYTDMSKSQWMTEEGQKFKGYFPHLSGGYYKFRGDVRPENCITSQIKADGSQPAETYIAGTYQEASKALVEGMQDGWGFVLDVGTHYMTVYGVGINDEGNITSLIFSDNNNSTSSNGFARQVDVYPTSSSKTGGGDKTMGGVGYGNEIVNYYGLRSKGLTFDTYTMTMTGAAGEEDLFSHYLNLVVDGHQNYELKYDLRDADEDGSPVVSNLSDGTHVKTGNLSIKDGKVTFIDSTDENTKEYDRGGKVAGTITYEEKEGNTSRTLTVDRTDTIAAEIHLNAADGNTLEVTGDNTATFGKLTGTGNLDKTGSGTAEVTGEVTLKGSIAVQEGKFVLGSSAELGSDTVITVGAAGSMESKADAAVLLTISSGTHTNDGTMTLETTVAGGTLKGSGSFAKVTVEEGGTLIIGNSPGHQEYTDMLTVNGGDVVFCVDGLATASSAESTGWGSDTYSIIHMNDHEFNYEGGQIFIDLSGAAAEALTLGAELTLVDGMGNVLTEEQLSALAANTSFRLTAEEGAAVTFNTENLVQPNFRYGMSGSSLMLTIVPEPATVTLSLLALAGLCTRRRR